MAYLTTAVLLLALLCVLNLVLTFGVIRRLRAEEPAGQPGTWPGRQALSAGATVGPFSAADIDGSGLDRDSLTEGLLVTFLSPSCPACEELLPLIVERAREHGSARVLAVVVRDRDKDVDFSEYVARLAPVARVVVTFLGDQLTEAFAIQGLPAYVEMGPDGRVASSGRAIPRGTGPARVGA